MTNKKKTTLLAELVAGGPLVKLFKILALLAMFVGFIFSIAVLADSREGFGFRGFIAYAGMSLLAGVAVFELAEILRWMQNLYERFDLYDKIDKH